MKYLIQVDATREFTRTYRAVAESEEAALKVYHTGVGDLEWIKDDIMENFECVEDADTARVHGSWS
mgnify:CR=1 FL=1